MGQTIEAPVVFNTNKDDVFKNLDKLYNSI